MRLRPLQSAARTAAVLALAVLGATALAAGAQAQSTTASDGVSADVHHGVKPQHPGIHAQAVTASSRNTLTVRSSSSTGVVSPTPKVYLARGDIDPVRDGAGYRLAGTTPRA